MILHPAVNDIAERRQRIDKALRNGRLTRGDGAALLENYAYLYKDGLSPVLGMGHSGAADPNEANEEYIPFTISVLDEDRDGDIVIPLGCQLENYGRNPVVFFGHQEWEIPIGTSKSPDGRLCVFPEENRIRAYWYPDYPDPDSDFIAGKVRRGVLSAASIAFVPIEAYRRDQREKGIHEAAHTHNQPLMPPGWLFKRYDLSEWSVVGVPSNAGAIRDSLDSEKSFLSPKLQKALRPYAAVAKGCWRGWCPCPETRGDVPTVTEKGCASMSKSPSSSPRRSLRSMVGKTRKDSDTPEDVAYEDANIKVGDRVRNQRTGEAGIVRQIRAGKYEPEALVVHNGISDWWPVGRLYKTSKGKSAKKPCGCHDCKQGQPCGCKGKRKQSVQADMEGAGQLPGSRTGNPLPTEENEMARKGEPTFRRGQLVAFAQPFRRQGMSVAAGTEAKIEAVKPNNMYEVFIQGQGGTLTVRGDEIRAKAARKKDALQDCVSRKIEVLVREGRKPPSEDSQTAAIAYSYCREGKKGAMNSAARRTVSKTYLVFQLSRGQHGGSTGLYQINGQGPWRNEYKTDSVLDNGEYEVRDTSGKPVGIWVQTTTGHTLRAKAKQLAESSGSAGGYTVPVSDDTTTPTTPGTLVCDVCGGSGNCPQCEGTGELNGKECPECHGAGECVGCGGVGNMAKSVRKEDSWVDTFKRILERLSPGHEKIIAGHKVQRINPPANDSRFNPDTRRVRIDGGEWVSFDTAAQQLAQFLGPMKSGKGKQLTETENTKTPKRVPTMAKRTTKTTRRKQAEEPPPEMEMEEGDQEEKDAVDEPFNPKPSAMSVAKLYAHMKAADDFLGGELPGMDHPGVSEALTKFKEEHLPGAMDALKGIMEEHHPDHDLDKMCKALETDSAGPTEETGEANLVDAGDVPPEAEPFAGEETPEEEALEEEDKDLTDEGNPEETKEEDIEEEGTHDQKEENPDTEEILERYRSPKGMQTRVVGTTRRAKDGKVYLVRKGQFKVGDQVAWTMQDGHVMAGKITFLGFSTYDVTRVDGGTVTVPQDKVHPASNSEIQEAINFYKKSSRRSVQKDLRCLQCNKLVPGNPDKCPYCGNPDLSPEIVEDSKDLTNEGNSAETAPGQHGPGEGQIIKEEHLSTIKDAADHLEAVSEAPDVPKYHASGLRMHAKALHGVHKDLTDQGKVEAEGGAGAPLSNEGNPAELKNKKSLLEELKLFRQEREARNRVFTQSTGLRLNGNN